MRWNPPTAFLQRLAVAYVKMQPHVHAPCYTKSLAPHRRFPLPLLAESLGQVRSKCRYVPVLDDPQ